MYDLAARLGIPLPYAVGIMEMLWEHAAKHTPRGDIGSLPDEAIREACCFARKAEALIDALVNSKWLDRDPRYRLVIHDWPDHCENSVKKWLQRNRKEMLPVYGKCLDIDQPKEEQSPPSREAEAKAEAFEVFTEGSVRETRAPVPFPVPDPEQFQRFAGIFLSLGSALSEADLRKCAMLWVSLDLAEQLAAMKHALAKSQDDWLRCEVRYIPRPWNYLSEKQWQRIAVVKGRDRPMSRGESAHSIAAKRFMEEG